jgi:OFA family oxalate/formate antiporter-like MFS transporter
LLLKPKMRRYVILAAAAAMQLCLGATYSWAVFVGPLRELLGLSQGFVQLPFTVFYLVFPATTALAGTLLPKIGPRRSAMLGGVLFGSGWILASLGSKAFALVILGVGIVSGVGVGFAYIVPIAVAVQWFPAHKGLVTGIAVAGFGGGAALVSQIAGRAMGHAAISPFELFAGFGMAFMFVICIAGTAMRYSPDGLLNDHFQLPLKEIAGRTEFRLLYAAMIAALAAGFAVNANLKELSPVKALETGVAAVSLFAVANAGGRIAWGALFDRMKSVAALRLNLVFQSLVLSVVYWLVRGPAGLLLFAVLAGFNYGGVLVLYAATVARVFGGKRVGQVYGLLFTANIVAAPAPVFAGYIYDWLGTFFPAFAGLAVLMLFAAWSLGGAQTNGRAATPGKSSP